LIKLKAKKSIFEIFTVKLWEKHSLNIKHRFFVVYNKGSIFILHSFDKLATFPPFLFGLVEHAAQYADA